MFWIIVEKIKKNPLKHFHVLLLFNFLTRVKITERYIFLIIILAFKSAWRYYRPKHWIVVTVYSCKSVVCVGARVASIGWCLINMFTVRHAGPHVVVYGERGVDPGPDWWDPDPSLQQKRIRSQPLKKSYPVPDHIWQIYFFTIVVFFWVCISNEIERKTIRTRPVPVPTSGKPGSWSNPFGTKLILFFKKNRIRLKQPDQDPLKNIRIHQNNRNRICNKTIPGSEYHSKTGIRICNSCLQRGREAFSDLGIHTME